MRVLAIVAAWVLLACGQSSFGVDGLFPGSRDRGGGGDATDGPEEGGAGGHADRSPGGGGDPIGEAGTGGTRRFMMPPAESPACEILEEEGLLCREGWCWLLDGQQGNSLHDAHADSPTSMWAVGAEGTILFWNGSRWNYEASPSPGTLRSVHAVAGGEPWAVGDGGVLRRVNGIWREIDSPAPGELWKIRVVGDDEAWVIGEKGLFQWTGGAWHWRSGAVHQSLWTDGRHDIWVAGPGAVRRWNGSTLETITKAAYVGGTEGSPPIIAHRGRVSRWTGRSFVEIFRLPSDAIEIVDVSGMGPNDLTILALSRTSYPVSHFIYHWDGLRLAQVWEHRGQRSTLNPEPKAIVQIEGASVLSFENRGVIRTVSPDEATAPFRLDSVISLLPLGPEEIWAVKEVGLLETSLWRWDGQMWTQQEEFFRPSSLAGKYPDDVWLLERQRPAQWDGQKLRIFEFGPFSALATRSERVWAVGRKGITSIGIHNLWTIVPVDTSIDLHSVWVAPDIHDWAAAAGDTILHWHNSNAWMIPPGIDPEVKLDISQIKGTNRNNIWAVGASIHHWDGSVWGTVDSVPATRLYPSPRCHAIWFDKKETTFVSCSSGFYRRTDQGWKRLPIETPPNVIAGPPGLGIAATAAAQLRYCLE